MPRIRPPKYKRRVCGEDLVVQRYGGGVRYYCPYCGTDRDPGSVGHPVSRVWWTNGMPPEDRKCKNEIKVWESQEIEGAISRILESR